MPFPLLIFWFGASMLVYALNRHHPNPKVGHYTQQAAYRFYGVTGFFVAIATLSSPVTAGSGTWSPGIPGGAGAGAVVRILDLAADPPGRVGGYPAGQRQGHALSGEIPAPI
ncbi:MAG: hypothetical protein MZV65_41295 [Chromatiales bacterium]|nr:hypothetical protein [Chromatiales bacterium]